MKSRWLVAMAMLGTAAWVTSAWACPENPKCAKGDAKVVTVSQQGEECPHAKKAAAGAESDCPHAKKATEAGGSACCAESAKLKTVAGEAGDCPHAEQAASEGHSGCGGAAKTVAAAGDTHACGKNVQAILASLPSMKYRVGEQVTGCSKSAASLATETKEPMKYVVGEEVFDSEGDAVARLTAVLASEMESMRTVQYSVAGECMRCPMTAKKIAEEKKTSVAYRVAGFDFAAEDQAQKAAKLAAEAADAVKLSYKVGDKSFCCDKMAGAEATKSGAKMTYVVGDKQTCCDKEANALLTEAKVHAMVEAAASVYEMITS